MSSRLLLDYMIMHLFSVTAEQKDNSAKKDLFSKIKIKKFFYQESLHDYSGKK